VNKRNRKLHLVDHVNDLVSRARERFAELGWSKLEELSWKEDEGARKLLRDIRRVRQNLSAAKTIDWAQHKGILSKLSDEEHFAHSSGNDIALACYARVLELIVEEPKWEKLREQSQALVFWLLKIGHPGTEGRDGLRVFNRMASLRALFAELEETGRKRETKLAKFEQLKIVIKKSREDIEDDRLMELVRIKGDTYALAQLRQRYLGWVKKKAKEILGSDSAVDDIAQKVFIQVWKAAPHYVHTAKFTTWLTEIAKNLALNERKRAIKEKQRKFAYVGEHENKAIYGGDSDRTKSAKEDALRALSQLSPQQRRIIEVRFGLCGCNGKDHQALADELGITASEAKRLEQEALSKMRQVLDS
jgi:RNA polymerase sigma-70 factor (ECF subfamily)